MSQAMSRAWIGRIAIGSLTLSMVALTPFANAAAGQTKAATGGKKAASKVTFVEAPSSENPAAREKRLKRECSGRPNAGMCLGHTR